MGKKSTWFSAIKRVFSPNSKDKLPNETDKTSSKEKKSGRGGRLKHALFREPSSIEKILGEVDQQRLFIAHPQQQQPQQQPEQQQPEKQQPEKQQPEQQQPEKQLQQQQLEQQLQQQQQLEQQQRQLEQQQYEKQQQQQNQQKQQQEQHKQQQQQDEKQQQQEQQEQHQRQEQKQQKQQQQPSSSCAARPSSPISRPKITSPPPARPASTYPSRVVVHRPTEISHGPEPTLQQQHVSATSIQAAYRGHLTRRKVRGSTAHVRLQGVVRGQNVKRQTVNAMKQMQLLVRIQTQIQSRRIQMLENQALKRQANNNNDKQPETSLGNNPSEMGDEYWDDSFITKEEREARMQKKVEAVIKRERAMAYAYSHKLGKTTPTSAGQTSLMDIRTGGYPWWWNWLDRQLPSDNRQFTTTSFNPTPDHKPTHKQLESPTTPMSSRSMAPSRTRTRTPPNRIMKYFKPKGSEGSPYSVNDNDSLMSCPAFSGPNYMSPTISARAKARPTSNPKDRGSPSTPGSETSKRRFSFPFTPDNIHRNRSPRSVGNMSVNSAISVPASLGRKPFNRFV